MHCLVWIGVLLILMPSATLAAEGASPSWTFQMDYVVDSTGVGRLSEPSWSIEGRFLAVMGKGGVFVHDLSTRQTSRAVMGRIWQFVWLPGDKLVYALRGNQNSELHTLDLSTRKDERLLSIPTKDLKGLQ